MQSNNSTVSNWTIHVYILIWESVNIALRSDKGYSFKRTQYDCKQGMRCSSFSKHTRHTTVQHSFHTTPASFNKTTNTDVREPSACSTNVYYQQHRLSAIKAIHQLVNKACLEWKTLHRWVAVKDSRNINTATTYKNENKNSFLVSLPTFHNRGTVWSLYVMEVEAWQRYIWYRGFWLYRWFSRYGWTNQNRI